MTVPAESPLIKEKAVTCLVASVFKALLRQSKSFVLTLAPNSGKIGLPSFVIKKIKIKQPIQEIQ